MLGNVGGSLIQWCHGIVVAWASVVWSYVFLWLGGFLHNKSCLLRGAPRTPLVCILLCSSLPLSYACLATLRVDFFKGLRVQSLAVRNGVVRSLTRSVFVAEVTRRYKVSPTPLFMLPVFRDHDPLHEVSGVKVPRPASPFITHETSIVIRRDGGCCISWQLYGWVYWYFDLVRCKVM